MMDRLAAMRVFTAVADAGSLSAAGRRLNIPLATVSRQLASLEEQLGMRLLTRTTRQLSLTEPGRQYLESCRRILAELEAAELALAGQHGEPRGEMAITAPALFGRLHVVPIVVQFLEAFPLVTARLLLVDRVVDLIEEGLDVSVRIGALPDSSVMATRVGSVRLVTCTSPAYLAKHGTPAAPQELAGHDCISFGSFTPAERWIYAGPAKSRRVAVHSRVIVNTADAAIDAARAGLGITKVLSYQAEASLADGSLRLILEDFEPEPIPVSLLHREDRLPQAKVQRFIAFAAPRLRAALKAEPGRARQSRPMLPKA
jgi:DNA-binding transcriptional LysR family regulator